MILLLYYPLVNVSNHNDIIISGIIINDIINDFKQVWAVK